LRVLLPASNAQFRRRAESLRASTAIVGSRRKIVVVDQVFVAERNPKVGTIET
jgi:hypothetical protein